MLHGELKNLPYFIRPLYISREGARKIITEEETMFKRAAVTALGLDVFSKRNFTVRFAGIFEKENGPNAEGKQ